MQLKRVVAAVGASAAMMSGIMIGSTSANAAPGCPSLYVVAIPGTWETGHDKPPGPGMLSGVTRGLPRNTQVDYVTYAATAFPWEGDVYGSSKKQAVNAARGLISDKLAACGNTRAALVGYSQGADAAGDLAAEIGTGISKIPADRVAAVGLISDPRRSPTDVQVGPIAPGAGGGGARPGGFGWLSDRTRTICAVDDLYCATATDDFVTRFAGFLAQSSDANPANLWRYQIEAGQIMTDLMAHGGVPTLQAQLSETANQQRAKDLERFYRSQAHTLYGSYQVGGGKTAITWMRDWIASHA
ncbi:cutinase family protein [Nocardia mangyaensis]|uniref:cutinase family protein n=1 Tax=Nocardia mangyaensis TaxID=2213200 RepID=UPI0026766C2E|nr:cutinase family protein [Nocardia mangyaensis]MDO3647509.1 cutinase family protein [Nocardia mangyaensis]